MRRKLKRISPAGYSGYYYLLSEWRDADEAGFDLLLTDGRQAWKCQVHRDSLHQMAVDADRDLYEYCAETHVALTSSTDDSSDEFDFEIKSSGHRVQLTWKKNIAGDDVKFKLGSLQLSACPDPGDVVCRMLDFEVDHVTRLQSTINDLESENERLKQQTEAVLERLDTCVTEKDSLEQDLFGKFKILINSKKSRIRELKQQVDKAREQVTQAEAQVRQSHASATASAPAGADDQADGGGGVALSRDDSGDSSSWSSAASGHLSRKQSVFANTQLLEDEEKPVVTQPPAKRRRRKESGPAGRQPDIPLPPSMGTLATQPSSRPASSLRRKPQSADPGEAEDTGNQLEDCLNDM